VGSVRSLLLTPSDGDYVRANDADGTAFGGLGVRRASVSRFVQLRRDGTRRGCRKDRAEAHSFKAMVNLQVGKAHLDAFALVTGFEECLCSH
jgi:hypothetical protein